MATKRSPKGEKKELPLGKSSFSKLVEGNCIYVDKTRYIYPLFRKGGAYFLSRPRRFGKSLTVSILKEIFQGHRDLFKGYWIYDRIDWEKYPLVHLDFMKIDFRTLGLEKAIDNELERISQDCGIPCRGDSISEKFSFLIGKLAQERRIAVLVDEYDKPVTEYIEDIDTAVKNRDILRNFYSVLKGQEEKIDFLFMTGISRFTRLSIFSDLNHLTDISFHKDYSKLLGYTVEEIKKYFDAYIDEWLSLHKPGGSTKAELMEKLKDYYNGYSWNGKDFVYNPYSINNFFDNMEFKNYWFASGTTTSLVKLVKEKNIAVENWEHLEVREQFFDKFDIADININLMLFQTGYLTVKKRLEDTYVLSYPNREVEYALLNNLMEVYSSHSPEDTEKLIKEIKDSLEKKQVDPFIHQMKAFIASIPYNLVEADVERFYHLVFYLVLKLLIGKAYPEKYTNLGRIDTVVETDSFIYIFEFKMGSADEAFKQILEKKYYEQYLAQSKSIILLGIGFSVTERNISDYKYIEVGRDDLPADINKLLAEKLPIHKTFSQEVNEPQIIKFFQVGQSLKPTGPNPKLFQGRDDIIRKILGSFHGGVQNERYFLDGIRRVGKTSIINFLPSYLPGYIIPVFIDFDLQSSGLRGPIDSAVVLQNFCDEIRKKTIDHTGAEVPAVDPAAFKKDAGKAFQDFLALFRQHFPDKTPLLMIDEFQDLLFAISRTGSKEERDTLVLDQLRGLLDQGHLYTITTGSIRFDGLSNIVRHRIFGSLTPLPISFLSEESVGNVLRAGFGDPVKIPHETVKCIYELTGGYPWLVQSYGSKLVDLLNEERRIAATPLDVEYITDHIMLTDSRNFEYWWPVKQLGIDEERFIERLFREYPDSNAVSIKDYFNGIRTQEKLVYMKAFQNLRSCEVLDSTQASTLKIRGNVLKRWLLTQMQADNRLKIRVHEEEQIVRQGKTGIFIDHENLLKTLERVSRARGVIVPADREKSEWLSGILKRLVEEAQRRTGDIHYKVTVAFWSRPDEAQLLPAYFKNGFNPQQPEDVKMANAVDFKLVDEVRRVQQQASLEKSNLGKVIIVSGDGDFASMVRTLINEGIDVQIWGGSNATNQKYARIVGENNIVVIDDVCGL